VTSPGTTTEKDVGRPAENGRRPRPRPRRGGMGVTIVVVLVAAAAVVVAVLRPWEVDTAGDSFRNTTPFSLAKVEKGNLSATSQETGKLGYAGSYAVVNKASGTATRLPSIGDVISAGKPFYRVDNQPVILLRGAYVPVYRTLTRGLKGLDVRQLNAALVELKYATTDQVDPTSDYFGSGTYWALSRFQKAVGIKKSGKLTLGQVIFLPVTRLRITKVDAIRGASVNPGQTVIEGSSTDRQATLKLNASQQAEVKVGDKVTVTMPTGSTTPGEVSVVGKVATAVGDDTTIDVSVKLLKPHDTGNLDQAPVQIAIVSDTAKNVLSVPVNALLALAGGGYAVEVVDAGGAHTLIRVAPGLIDDSKGRVEVSGTGLAEGQNVVVPSS
jgi:peptidoglycan hydrolase-like protein with peptidoglycan-binding domain